MPLWLMFRPTSLQHRGPFQQGGKLQMASFGFCSCRDRTSERSFQYPLACSRRSMLYWFAGLCAVRLRIS